MTLFSFFYLSLSYYAQYHMFMKAYKNICNKIDMRYYVMVFLLFISLQLAASFVLVEPLQTVVVTLLILALLKIRRCDICLKFTLCIGSVLMAMRLFAMFLAASLLRFASIEDAMILSIASLMLEILFYMYSSKWLKSIANFIKKRPSMETNTVVYAIGMTTFIFSLIAVFNLQILNASRFSTTIMVNMILIVICLLLLTGTLVIFIEKTDLKRIEQEKQIKNLTADLDNIIKRHHKYRDSVPTLLALFNELVHKVEATSQEMDINSTHLQTYEIAIKKLSQGIVSEFENDDVSTEIRDLHLPDKYIELGVLLGQKLKEARTRNIKLFIQNKTTQWHTIPIENIHFFQLIGNLLNNALKELYENDMEDKKILVNFLTENNHFAFSVRDNGRHFPIEILKRLGEKGNTTTGTGHGYLEIIQILESCRASIFISEVGNPTKSVKNIKITFDGQNRKEIKSNYRQEVLQYALQHSIIKVVSH